MRDYEIANVTGVCCATQRSLDEGEEFYAALFERADGFDRRDYSLDAWAGPQDDMFCYWKSRIPKKKEQKRLFVDNEVMVNLFTRLAASEEEVKQHFRFVLALILMRKRILKYVQTMKDDDSEIWQMRLTRDQSEHRVLNPKMDESQLSKVSDELGAILHGDMQAFANVDVQPTTGALTTSDDSA